jgi:hypothetical protein
MQVLRIFPRSTECRVLLGLLDVGSELILKLILKLIRSRRRPIVRIRIRHGSPSPGLGRNYARFLLVLDTSQWSDVRMVGTSRASWLLRLITEDFSPASCASLRTIQVVLRGFPLILVEGGQCHTMWSPMHEQHPVVVIQVPVTQLQDSIVEGVNVLKAGLPSEVAVDALGQSCAWNGRQGIELLARQRSSRSFVPEPYPGPPRVSDRAVRRGPTTRLPVGAHRSPFGLLHGVHPHYILMARDWKSPEPRASEAPARLSSAAALVLGRVNVHPLLPRSGRRRESVALRHRDLLATTARTVLAGGRRRLTRLAGLTQLLHPLPEPAPGRGAHFSTRPLMLYPLRSCASSRRTEDLDREPDPGRGLLAQGKAYTNEYRFQPILGLAATEPSGSSASTRRAAGGRWATTAVPCSNGIGPPWFGSATWTVSPAARRTNRRTLAPW